MELTKTRMQVLEWLDSHLLPYEFYTHERAHTIDACLQMPFITKEVTICKNILLCNRQQTAFFLLLLKPLTPFKTSVVSKLLGSSRLSFAPENALEELLHLSSGSVSPLGLLYDQEHKITLCYEKGVLDTPKIAFHPCDNTATIVFEQSVFWNDVMKLMQISPVCVMLPEND